jgi:flagellum-specific peptidoglycan hydrolase FlgJ
MAALYEPSSGIAAKEFFNGQTVVPYYAAAAAGLKMAGYATSPTYHKKLFYLIETYELWQFDIDLIRALENR